MKSTNELKKWIIYMYTFPNGKRYIGKTHRSLKERQLTSTWAGYVNCPVLWKAITKYGTLNIKQDILIDNYMSDEYAARLEMIYIALFKTNCNKYCQPSYGYNETDGGEGAFGYKHTEESKEKMRRPRYQHRGENHHSSKPVYCSELNRVFANAREAEKETGVSFKSISNNCRGKSKATRGGNTGFEWLHWEIRLDLMKPSIIKAKTKNTRRVYCIELDRYFDSAKEAENQGYGQAGSIRGNCCNTKMAKMRRIRIDQLHWLYEEDVNDEIVTYILNLIKKRTYKTSA